MNAKLTSEQRDALRDWEEPLPVEDEQTHQLYYLLDHATLERLQREADRQAILRGIADMEAGRVLTLEELDTRVRAKLGLPETT